jgi:hypothetical protein
VYVAMSSRTRWRLVERYENFGDRLGRDGEHRTEVARVSVHCVELSAKTRVEAMEVLTDKHVIVAFWDIWDLHLDRPKEDAKV